MLLSHTVLGAYKGLFWFHNPNISLIASEDCISKCTNSQARFYQQWSFHSLFLRDNNM